MLLKERIELLAELGHFLRSGGDEALESVIQHSYFDNRWFSPDNSRQAISAIATAFLDDKKLSEWARHYQLADNPAKPQTVGLVMAGNIPLVGFHDWLCVFVFGHRSKVKLSDKDKRLLPFLVKKMGDWSHESWAYTEFLTETDHLKAYDAVIATGSNNSARYFEEYFRNKPHIIRRNRNAVAVLNGLESKEELIALGRDIFSYFGLGCRNVSKLYVPHGYNFDFLLETLHDHYKELANHDKYKNNFDYNFTLFILNNIPHLNNGCTLLKEDSSLQSRIASVHYEYYGDWSELDEDLLKRQNEIQCIITGTQPKELGGRMTLPFGQSQEPGLMDYPDGVDVMAFLGGL